jgi:sucrose-6-phosphate hydrolase SacC (GH32 family)
MTNQKRTTKREIAMNIFMDNYPMMEKIGEKAFRKTCIEAIINATGSNPRSSATMYQNAKSEAIKSGKVPDFGRTARGTAGGRKPKVRIPEGSKWVRVNAKGNPVAYYPSRSAARADKSHEGTKVVKM